MDVAVAAAAAAAEASVAAQAEAEARANAQAAAEASVAAETTEAKAEATAAAKSRAAAAAVAPAAADAGDQGSPFALPGRNSNRNTDTAQHLRELRLCAPHIRLTAADGGTGRLPDGDQRRPVSPAAHQIDDWGRGHLSTGDMHENPHSAPPAAGSANGEGIGWEPTGDLA